MNKPNLTLMCGLPRSGKSSWIVNNKKKYEVVVCPDEIRLDLFGHTFHKMAEPMIWTITEYIIGSLMKQRLDIILDACNMTSVSNKWLNLAEKYDYQTRLVLIDTPIETCLKRNKVDKKLPVELLKTFGRCFDPDRLEHPSNTSSYNKVIRIKEFNAKKTG